MSRKRSIAEWEPVPAAFYKWLGDRGGGLEPGLPPEPILKVLAFLALLESQGHATYEDIRRVFDQHGVIKGTLPAESLRTALHGLAKTLDAFQHPLEMKASRGRFQLRPRRASVTPTAGEASQDRVVLLDRRPAVKAEDIARSLVIDGRLPFQASYFLEWSARWWEAYSAEEAEDRAPYEVGAFAKLEIGSRLFDGGSDAINFLGLAPGEGIGEIAILKMLFARFNADDGGTLGRIHYLAVDSSPRLLRNHISFVKETFAPELEQGRLLCAGVVADIFSGLHGAIENARQEFQRRGPLSTEERFLPSSWPTFVTYLGNCLGNDQADHEARLFSTIYSVIPNRPIDILVGVSVMRAVDDTYVRSWDEFLLQMPRHLLETKKLLRSTQPSKSDEFPEFKLPSKDFQKNNEKAAEKIQEARCPKVQGEPYLASNNIEGKIYRFEYRLAFDLELTVPGNTLPAARRPKGSLITLYNIIKYKVPTLVRGIERGGLFRVQHDPSYHLVVDTPNGAREYAVFSVHIG